MLLGKLHAVLYNIAANHVQVDSSTTDAVKTCFVAVDNAKLWHMRLGHLPFYHLSHLIPSCDVKSCSKDFICKVCPAARQTRKTFPTSSIKTDKAFDMVNIDVWGPYKVKTFSGCTQFITIVDDYTRFTWIHLLKFRTDLVVVMNNFLNYVHTQFDAKVLFVRSNNANGLIEGDMKELFLHRGIHHQTSCARTPQQNNVVERKHRHLLETARAIFLHSKVPDQFWGDSILCSAYLINRMPLSSIHNISPYEKVCHTKPSLDHLRTFGCLCFISTSKVHRSKFDPRAHPAVFLGYLVTQKGYKVLDMISHRILVTRDVTFYERHFPFHILPTTISEPDPIFTPSVTYDCFDDTFPTSSSTPPAQPTNQPPPSPTLILSLDTPTSPSSCSSIDIISPASPPGSPEPAQTQALVDLKTIFQLEQPTPSLRQSTRVHKPRAYLNQYYCNSSSAAITNHWCNLFSFSSFPSSYKTFLATSSESIQEPSNYTEASSKPEWIEAMNKEIQALVTNNTWDLVDLPSGK